MQLFMSISFYDLGVILFAIIQIGNHTNDVQVFPLSLPHVEVILQKFLLGLISASHMIAPTLISHQLSVGLHHHGVKVLHPLHHVCRHGVTGPQWQSVADQALK